MILNGNGFHSDHVGARAGARGVDGAVVDATRGAVHHAATQAQHQVQRRLILECNDGQALSDLQLRAESDLETE